MKDFLSATLSRIVVVGVQLAYVKLYSNFLNNRELGLYFFLTTISYSLNAFVFVPLDYYQQAKLYGYLRDNISLKSLVVFNIKCISVAAGLMLTLAAILGLIHPEYGIYALLAAALSITLYCGTALKGTLNNLEHRRFVSAVMAGEAVLKVILFYCFVAFMPRNAITLICSMVAALTLMLIPLIGRTKKLPIYEFGTIERVLPGDVLRFAYPVSIGAVVNWVQLQGYRMILVPMGFTETVGIYATVSGIGNAGMAAASAIFGQVYLPKIYKSSGGYTKRYLRNALFLATGILFIGAVASNLIVTSITKAEFGKFSWLILYGIVAEAGNFLVGALCVHLTILGHTRQILIASLIGLVSVVGGFLLIYVLNFVSLLTIGLPIILSQLTVAYYLYSVHDKRHVILGGSAHA